MSIATKTLIAMTGQELLAAGSISCSSAGNSTDCLSVTNAAGNPICAWLMLSGSCADASSTAAINSPATCCSSQAQGSMCKQQSDFLPDGVCSVPTATPNSGISLDEMTHWLRFAFAVYCPESEIINWNCGANCDAVNPSSIRYQKKIGFTDNIEHAAMVGYDSQYGEIVVSFKGTDNDAAFIENWMTNLDILKENPFSQYPDASLHSGFWNAWLSLKDDVVPAIQEVHSLHSGTNKIRLVGHSLGGAIATNAAMDLKLNYGYDTSVVNFGSPRPGDEEYHKALLSEVTHWRVTHNNDLVPHVPPEASGFYHASTEVHFPDRTGLNFKICDGSGEDDSCANACAPWLTCTSIDDHMDYLELSITCGSSSSVVV